MKIDEFPVGRYATAATVGALITQLRTAGIETYRLAVLLPTGTLPGVVEIYGYPVIRGGAAPGVAVLAEPSVNYRTRGG